MNKNQYNPEIHHRRSIRLKGHDYAGGGVYDNLGVEAIYKSGKGLRDDLDFPLICDASKPLGFIKRQWIKNIALPRKLTRLVDIPMDQVRGLRARELFSFFKKNANGGYLRMGESVGRICRNLGCESPQSSFMSEGEAKKVSEFDTALRKLSPDEFQVVFRHGYEVCSAVLYGIQQGPFLEYDQQNFSWMK